MPWHFGPAKTCAVSSICTKMCVWDKILWLRSMTEPHGVAWHVNCFQSCAVGNKALDTCAFSVLWLYTSEVVTKISNTCATSVLWFHACAVGTKVQKICAISVYVSRLPRYTNMFEFIISWSHASAVFTTVSKNCALSVLLEKIE